MGVKGQVKLMDYKLIAVDMDGTLLNTKSQLTDETVKAVRLAMDKGVKFVLSTGRPYEAIVPFIAKLGVEKMPYILYNGAMVMVDGEIIYSCEIDVISALKIVEEGHKRNANMICWSKNKLYAEQLNERVIKYKSISDVTPIIVEDLSVVAKKGLTKFVWLDDIPTTNKNFEELEALLGDKINVHPTRVDFLEFVSKDCSKATAMGILENRYGILNSQTVGVGDGFNDVAMIDYAGLGVAMQNAPDGVKAHADMITDSCDNDGVAKLIYKLLNV